MAGKMRVAAKLFLGTTVLASGGGGAYYYTTHGLVLPNFSQSDKPAATADLDAVASAWAEPSKSHVADPSLSSPIARSANPESSQTEKKAAKAPADDRYATTIDAPAKEQAAADAAATKEETASKDESDADAPIVAQIDAPPSDKAPTNAEREPTPAVEVQPVALASHTETTSDENAANEDAPSPTVAAPAPPETAVARGQEPKDDAARKTEQLVGRSRSHAQRCRQRIANRSASRNRSARPLSKPILEPLPTREAGVRQSGAVHE